MRSKGKYIIKIAVILIILTASVTSGCISESETVIEDFLGSFTERILPGYETYRIDKSQLTIPDIPVQGPDSNEDLPSEISGFSPGFEIASAYYYTQFYENSDGVVGIKIRNLGDNEVFIYRFGIVSQKLSGYSQFFIRAGKCFYQGNCCFPDFIRGYLENRN